ncbi:MAG: trans-aconitate 2-methyltransferase [Mesorhizobium amorphae]|nr:MAG: trans-aconitate 2-methyltransferase [Mesorhizobium amorphae]
MTDWSAEQYLRFAGERTRAARDLLLGVPPAQVRRAMDLGCGPGNSTELLVARYPEAEVAGIDSSPAMIAAARERLPACDFAVADIGAWEGENYDLLFANAVLQWLPDHAALLPRLVGCLAEGGSLAVQMPDNLDEPSHRAMREVAELAPFRDKLAAAAGERTEILGASALYALLKPLCRRVDVWRTTYHHPLGGVDGVVDWLGSTGLRPFLAPLDEGGRDAFLAEYRTRIAAAYPLEADGTLLLPFPRLFFVATR